MDQTRTLTIELELELDDALARLSQVTGRAKSALAREALTTWLHDREADVETARTLAEDDSPATLADIKKALGLGERRRAAARNHASSPGLQ